jgi:hypothetical protein
MRACVRAGVRHTHTNTHTHTHTHTYRYTYAHAHTHEQRTGAKRRRITWHSGWRRVPGHRHKRRRPPCSHSRASLASGPDLVTGLCAGTFRNAPLELKDAFEFKVARYPARLRLRVVFRSYSQVPKWVATGARNYVYYCRAYYKAMCGEAPVTWLRNQQSVQLPSRGSARAGAATAFAQPHTAPASSRTVRALHFLFTKALVTVFGTATKSMYNVALCLFPGQTRYNRRGYTGGYQAGSASRCAPAPAPQASGPGGARAPRSLRDGKLAVVPARTHERLAAPALESPPSRAPSLLPQRR